jgi:hypothetical protein
MAVRTLQQHLRDGFSLLLPEVVPEIADAMKLVVAINVLRRRDADESSPYLCRSTFSS